MTRRGAIARLGACSAVLCACGMRRGRGAGANGRTGHRSPPSCPPRRAGLPASRAKHHRRCPAHATGKKSHSQARSGPGAKPSTPKRLCQRYGPSARIHEPWTARPGSGDSRRWVRAGVRPPAPSAGSRRRATALPAAETPTAPAGPAHVQVTAEDSSGPIASSSPAPTVPAGQVVIEFVNHGQDEHNLHAVDNRPKNQKLEV